LIEWACGFRCTHNARSRRGCSVDKLVRVDPRGRVTIPVEIRRAIGLEPGQRVEVCLQGKNIVLKPIPRDLIAALSGCIKDGPSLTAALVREHAAELKRDDERCR
jgi:AbrB family looped-hinge helix DNA binding protein